MPVGIYSVCSAHCPVLQAAMAQAMVDQSVLLIESTSNQVDQFGGYTGMTPADFVRYAKQIASAMGFPWEAVVLGGDHLGPNVWQKEPARSALGKASDQVRAYVEAGYRKIHLDATMGCADDPTHQLQLDTIAERTALLCQAAEEGISSESAKPVYVIGSDVPTPGGATQTGGVIPVTSAVDVGETIERTRTAFEARRLHDAWQRVIAVVVQPGVEFGSDYVYNYDHSMTEDLISYIEQQTDLVYEAHSTDYQTPDSLRAMVVDHFAVLKVGPWLTFAYREAVFALAEIERLWLGTRKDIQLSSLIDIIDREMGANPDHWRRHHQGEGGSAEVMRKYGFSDRIRYYWLNPQISAAVRRLMENLSQYPAPLSLLSQYLPYQYEAVRGCRINNVPAELIRHKIGQVLSLYSAAAGMNGAV